MKVNDNPYVFLASMTHNLMMLLIEKKIMTTSDSLAIYNKAKVDAKEYSENK